jgi:hypothetical protein
MDVCDCLPNSILLAFGRAEILELFCSSMNPHYAAKCRVAAAVLTMHQSVVLQLQPTRSTPSGGSQTINAYGLDLRYYYVLELLFKLRDSQRHRSIATHSSPHCH